MSRPDVALVAPYPALAQDGTFDSGVAPYTARLAHALTGEGADVRVIAPQEPGEPACSYDGPVRVERRFPRGVAAFPAALAAAAVARPRTIHLQHELFLFGGARCVPGLAAGLVALRAAGRAPVVTLHQVVDPRQVDHDFVRLHRVRVAPGLARAALVAVQGVVERLAARTVVHERSLAALVPSATVVPHGVGASAAGDREVARRRLGVASDRLTVLCFGFVAPYKGLEEALEGARRAGRAVELVVAGGEHPRLAGNYAASLRERFGAAARFTGRVDEDDVGAWFTAADLALLPYPRPFSSSGALAHALAHGTPVLLSEALADSVGATRELAVAADAEAIAAALGELAIRPAGLEPLRAQAHDLAGGRSWPAVARRHLELYEEVLHADGAHHRRAHAA